MEYTHLGRSNLTVSRICLGTMHFGSRTPEDEAFAIMDAALDMGINFFDTANVYGGRPNTGRTETIIGRWLAQGGGRRDRIVLATKVYGPMVPHPGPNETAGISAYKVRKHLHDSLERLQTDRIDLYQIHHFDRAVTVEEFWRTFGRLEDDGDILYVGTSNFPGWGLAKFQMAAWHRGLTGLISEQTQYNLLNRIPELEVLPAAQELGIGVIPYMPLAGGLLTGRKVVQPGSRTADVWGEYGFNDDRQPQLDAFSALCADLGEPEHVVANAWTLAHPAVDSVIVGVRTLRHLEGLDRAASLKLSAATMARLDEVFGINAGRPLKSSTPAPEAYAW
ncbi:MAG: aldo/keto reductase [Anaerolineae bacterium]|jgi:aryl-alcohol dehydrogenase-like predicted oxidoreductase|nr:aldo/keto reductase [Anaerolineae bacterium]